MPLLVLKTPKKTYSRSNSNTQITGSHALQAVTKRQLTLKMKAKV
jgi:hypothetical protein